MFDPDGRLICATPHYSNLSAYFPADDGTFGVRLVAPRKLVRTNIATGSGGYFGIVEFSARHVAGFIRPATDAKIGITLRQGGQLIPLATERSDNPIARIIRVSVPVAGGQFSLEIRMPINPIGALEILLILLPILMWASGAVIGWFVVERLLLHPLGQMQKAISAFNAGDGPLLIPKLRTPALEISALGESFLHATEALTRHERELAEALARQKLLTREVHHRVKNNLQVVSSLINLHARGAQEPLVTEAYSSIQRRVDALAVVYRNYYAELEQSVGVSLRTLIGEIASNLRASSNSPERSSAIGLNLMTASASQDSAVPIAFLITEIVELIMLRDPAAPISISLGPIRDEPERACLSISSPALMESASAGAPAAERFQRIIGGLARQLRSHLDLDVDEGRYTVEIRILSDVVPIDQDNDLV